MRTITEILKDADACTDIEELDKYRKEIKENLREYPLVELEFAEEHIKGLVNKIAKSYRDEFLAFMKNTPGGTDFLDALGVIY